MIDEIAMKPDDLIRITDICLREKITAKDFFIKFVEVVKETKKTKWRY